MKKTNKFKTWIGAGALAATALFNPNNAEAQQTQHEHDILKQRGASKEVLVFEDKDNNINYTIPFTQGQDTLKLASLDPEKDYFVNLRNSQKFFEFTNEMGERERESLEFILNNGGTIRLPNDTKLEGEDGNVYLITGSETKQGVNSYAIGREDSTESVRAVIAHFGGGVNIEDYLQNTEKMAELKEDVVRLKNQLDDKNEYLSQKRNVISQQEREIDLIKEHLDKTNYSLGVNAVAQTGQNNMAGAEIEAGLGNWYLSGGFLSTLGTETTTEINSDHKHHPRLPLTGFTIQETTLEDRARAFTAGIERNVGTPKLSIGAMMKYTQQEQLGQRMNETYFQDGDGNKIDHQRVTSGIDNVTNRMFYGPRATARLGPVNINANVTTDFKGNYNFGGGVGVRFGGSRK